MVTEQPVMIHSYTRTFVIKIVRLFEVSLTRAAIFDNIHMPLKNYIVAVTAVDW